MLKKIRVYISILLITFLLTAPLIFSEAFSAQACPPPPPETLVSLYLTSDIIVVADFMSRKDGEILADEETYQYVDVLKNLKVSRVLKGKTGNHFTFTQLEYRSKTPPEENSDEDGNDYRYAPYGYQLHSELAEGNRYLFFFTKNEETGNYILTDDISGYRNLSDYDLNIHEKRIAELQKIVENKENQLAALTDWYLKCIEEPATRWDGVMSLKSSFNALGYEDEGDKASREKFVVDEDFSEYAPEIAENLSDSQKNFLSAIVFNSLHQNLFEEDGYNFYVSLDEIIKNWDKQRLAMFAFSIYQTADKTDVEKNVNAMRYISSVIDDDKLWEIAGNYREATEVKEEPEVSADSEEVKMETESINSVESPKENKLSADELSRKALQDFTNRYYHLLARNFAEESDAEMEN